MLRVIIGLLYVQLTDPTNVLRAVDIIILYRDSLRPENYFKGSSGVKRLKKAALGFFLTLRHLPCHVQPPNQGEHL